MHRMHLQFHADPTELMVDLLPAWLDDLSFYAAVDTGGGGRTALPAGSLPETVDLSDPILSVVLHCRPLVNVDSPMVEFLRANKDFLSIIPGQLVKDGLRESSLGSIVQNEEVALMWRAVMTRAKRGLLRGGVVIGPRGHKFDAPNHLYSPGARELALAGTPMLAIAGSARFELGGTG
jgi:hypothetical protein